MKIMGLTLYSLTLYLYSPNHSLYISCGTDKENLLDNQELLKLVIIYILHSLDLHI